MRIPFETVMKACSLPLRSVDTRFHILWLMLAVLTMPSIASAQDMSPAHFGDRLVDFMARLDLPATEEGKALLTQCASEITESGQFKSTVCYHDEENSEVSRLVRREVLNAVRGLRIEPAIVGGTAVPVWFNFSVAYRQTGDNQHVEVFENHLFNRERLGLNYTGAQRYNLASWRCRGGRGLPITVSVNLSAAGEVVDVRPSADGRCSRSIVRAIRSSSFIPARLNGQDVESLYMEVFFY